MIIPTWVLTKGMNTVRAEFNTVFPKRDKASDGTIGDLAHQLESASSHNPDISGRAEWKDGDKLNEVRAFDCDDDLRDESGNKVTMETVIQLLVTKGRRGDYLPFRYFIYNKRIWSKADNWKTRAYNGASPHTEHAHFTGDYSEKADNWTGSLGLATLVKVVKLKTHKKIDLDGFVISELHEGDVDKEFSGYGAVARMQRLVGVKDDGWYGTGTSAAVKAMMIRSNKDYKGDGRTIGLAEWRVLAGIFVG